MSATLSPGFADPVADSQACFRAVLAAMSRPGSIHTVPAVEAPAPLCAAAASAVLTLVDQETPLWLDPEAAGARQWIAFHTGAAIVPQQEARFVLALTLPGLRELADGSDEAPEASATIILQVASLGVGRPFKLEGPGLREPVILAVDGLPADFAAIWTSNHGKFPRGVDLILCAGSQVAALPRSVHVKEA